jgi:hypothetical protein
MTKVISILIVLVLIWGGWHFYLYWGTVKSDDGTSGQATVVNPDYLPGMPHQLIDSFNVARQNGPKAMGAWLSACDSQLSDPRRAWIEMDYVVAITRDNPQEAKRIFNNMKARIQQNSPVYPRVKELEATYE